MKFSKRLIAALTALVMLLTIVPAFALGEGEQRPAPLTEREREIKSAQLESFNSRLREMEKKYADTDYSAKSEHDHFATARLIVKSAMEVSSEGALAVVSGYNDWHVLQFATSEEAERAYEKLNGAPGVEWVEPDGIMSICAEPGSNSFHSWGFEAAHINAFEYNEWLYAKYGSDIANIPEVIVAVVDTGADLTHPFLAGRLVEGYNVPADNNNPQDGHNHGTHVSGTIVDGTLANVKVMPIRVLGDNGAGSTLDVALGMEYGYLHGAQVENLSLGGLCDWGEAHHLMAEVVDNAFNNGTALIIAAGNEYADANTSCPANVRRVCTVAAIDTNHNKASFSNYGELVDVAAPGVGINSSVIGGGFSSMDGTSMASPHVAAVAAMIKSANPEMNADELVTAIKGTAVPLNATDIGVGMVHLAGGDLFALNDAANASGGHLHFASSGNYSWTVDGNSVVSGNAGADSTTSALTTHLTVGPDQALVFDCKVSSEANDRLLVKVNGETVYTASGEQGWSTQRVVIPVCGSAKVTFEFEKNASGASGSDKAWIRNVKVEASISSMTNVSGGSVQFTSDGAHPWVVSEAEGAAMSGNAGVNGSSSTMSGTVDMLKGMVLVFKYKVSAAQGDNLIVKVDDRVVLTAGNTDGYEEFVYKVTTTGTHSVEFTFTKDGSGAAGDDCAYVRLFDYYHSFESAVNGSDNHLPFDNTGEYAWAPIQDYVCSTNWGMNSTESAFTLTLDMNAGETLSFRYKVSSDYMDKFVFYVDGDVTVRSYGDDWTSYTFTAEQSKTYEFKWAYIKNFFFSYGDDCACVDDIVYSGSVGMMGDADSNGAVNTADALLIMRYALGIVDGTQLDLANSDVDSSGAVDMADALRVMRMAMGL